MTEPHEIQEVIYKFYKTLFGQQGVRIVHLSDHVWAQRGRLVARDNEFLCQPIIEEEVRRVVFDIK